MDRMHTMIVLFERSKDVPGYWEAHCLDLDVVTQGRTLGEAVIAVREAMLMVIEDDLRMNIDPLRRRAPDEFWNDVPDPIGLEYERLPVDFAERSHRWDRIVMKCRIDGDRVEIDSAYGSRT